MAFFDDRESETLHNPSIVVYCINNLLVIIILIWQAFRYDLSAQVSMRFIFLFFYSILLYTVGVLCNVEWYIR